jgi:hypothetical protein
MTKLVQLLGSVMAAVNLPREMRQRNLETYVKTEFNKGDQAYVLECMLRGDALDRRNIV